MQSHDGKIFGTMRQSCSLAKSQAMFLRRQTSQSEPMSGRRHLSGSLWALYFPAGGREYQGHSELPRAVVRMHLSVRARQQEQPGYPQLRRRPFVRTGAAAGHTAKDFSPSCRQERAHFLREPDDAACVFLKPDTDWATTPRCGKEPHDA